MFTQTTSTTVLIFYPHHQRYNCYFVTSSSTTCLYICMRIQWKRQIDNYVIRWVHIALEPYMYLHHETGLVVFTSQKKKVKVDQLKIPRQHMTDIFSDSLIVSLMIVKETDGTFGKETDVI